MGVITYLRIGLMKFVLEKQFEATPFSIGQFIAAVFDSKWYVGMIEDIDNDNNDAFVNFMHPSGPAKSYHWPDRSDRCWVPLQHILCGIICPNLQTCRGQYQITVACEQKIQFKFMGLE